MQNHNGFRRIICVTILCALLIVSMGRATRVSAVGTTAAIAGTAFILTGAVYLSYVALTQGEMILPAAEELHNWLGGIGRKVSQYPSGAEAYQDIYQGILRDPTANVIDGVWSWTEERIKSFVNDFSDTRIIQDITGYYVTVEVEALNGFDYSKSIIEPLPILNGYDLSVYENSPDWELRWYEGIRILRFLNYPQESTFPNYYVSLSNLVGEFRNYKLANGTYILQQLVDGVWTQVTSTTEAAGEAYYRGSRNFYIEPRLVGNNNSYQYQGISSANRYSLGAQAVPYAPDLVIYDSVTEQDLPMAQAEERFMPPTWTDPDNDNRPIIPWVPIPQLPVNVTPPTGYVNPQWGFNLQDLLDKLEDLAGQLIDIGGIAALINDFAGLHGDNYYLEYNDGDTNYYTYYQPTIFDNDTEYVTYNIDISEQQDIVPVDLNTISLYTHNNYLDEVKDAARSFGSAIGEYVAFWHNCDPVVTYTILGSFVLILLGAFIGKWGHS